MRKAAITVGIVFAVFLVASLVFWATFDINQYRGTIQAQLQNALARPVTLGQMRLGLFPPSFQVDKLSIADDPAFENPKPFVQAERLSVSVGLFSLLRGKVVVTSLNLHQPVVELIKNQQGIWNYASLGAKEPLEPPASGQPESRTGSFSLESLSIRDGQVTLSDRQAGSPRTTYGPIDLELEDLAADKPFSLDVSFRLPGEGHQGVRLQGTGGPIPPGNVAATPFHATLDLNDVSLAALQQFLKEPVRADIQGVISGQTKIHVEPGTLAAAGSLEVEKARVRGVDLGYPVTAQYRVINDLKSGVLNIGEAIVKLGATAVNLTGSIESKRTPPRLGLQLKANGLSLAEAARLASAFGVAFSPDMAVKGRLDADLRITGTTDKPVLNGNLSAADVQVSGKDIPEPVQIKAVNFALTPSEIRSNNFEIVSGPTKVRSNIAVSQYSSAAPSLDARLEAPNAQLPAILGIAKAYGVKALDTLTGSGVLNLNMRLSGPVESLAGDSVLRALNGDATIDFSKLRFTGANLSQEISKVAGFLKPVGSAGRFTDISKMAGKITVTNGIAQTQDLKASLDVGTIGVTGKADLVSQVLDLRVNAVVGQAISRQVGGNAIGGFMKTALANSQGELVIPLIVTGSFQEPKVLPDASSFAKMRLQGLLPSSSNPAAGLSGLLGGLLGGKGGTQPQQGQKLQQQKQPPAQDALNQLLEGLSGTKKKDKESNPPK